MMGDSGGEKRLLAVNVDIIKKLFVPNVGLVVHKQKVEMVSIVGKVINLNEQTTKSTYYIDDGTDGIDVMVWKGGDEGKPKNNDEPVLEGSYVKVFGQIRLSNNALNFVSFKIVPIHDFNELTVHNLEVIKSLLTLRRMKFNQLATRGEPTSNGGGIGVPMQIDDSEMTGMNKPQTLILQTLRKCPKEEGMSREEIKDCLPSLDAATINSCLEFLSNEGHIFTTIDDDHFKDASSDN